MEKPTLPTPERLYHNIKRNLQIATLLLLAGNPEQVPQPMVGEKPKGWLEWSSNGHKDEFILSRSCLFGLQF
jgi:hypothetical protein